MSDVVVMVFAVFFIVDPFDRDAVALIEPTAQIKLTAAFAAKRRGWAGFRIDRSMANRTANRGSQRSRLRVALHEKTAVSCVKDSAALFRFIRFLRKRKKMSLPDAEDSECSERVLPFSVFFFAWFARESEGTPRVHVRGRHAKSCICARMSGMAEPGHIGRWITCLSQQAENKPWRCCPEEIRHANVGRKRRSGR